MSEANVPPRRNVFNELDALARANPASNPSSSSHPGDDWETVSPPGMLPVDSFPHAAAPPPGKEAPAARETQLLTLVQDLNRCNEVLLSRVNQLESALEHSQQALLQNAEAAPSGREADRLVAVQQQSMAQLLSDLEQSEAALKRQTILAETLQAQLEASQERNKYLERECALLQKRHTDKAQRLQDAEEACHDLRSRLQRQQRYTLQFKAALEKCLEAPAFHQTAADPHPPVATPPSHLQETLPTVNSAAMPRSERIQPWSATEATVPADSQLLSLVQSLQSSESTLSSGPGEPTNNSVNSEMASSPAELSIDSDAERQLWQDVERVIENSTSGATAPTISRMGETTSPVAHASDEVQFTEPMPWGTPVAKEQPVDDAASSSTSTTASVSHDHGPSSFLDATDVPGLKSPPVDQPSTTSAKIPALDAMMATQTSPSPVVHPLRPRQQKRKSLSAVELPSFPPLPKSSS